MNYFMVSNVKEIATTINSKILLVVFLKADP